MHRFFLVTCFWIACLGLVTRAQAGPPPLPNPFDSEICGDLFSTNFMDEPNGLVFNGAGSVKVCEKLCKRAASDCKAFARNETACWLEFYADSQSYESASCEATLEGAEAKMCKASTKASANILKADIKADLQEALDA